MKKNNETIIISVGGSLIVPENIDIVFLKDLKKMVEKHVENGKRFAIICGGGRTARNYQNAAREVSDISEIDADWIGTNATIINASLVKSIFKNNIHEEVIKNPTKRINFKEKILIAGGWKPGFSSDYDAVLIAKKLKAKKIINLSNIDYVYDKDPRKFQDAKKIENVSWEEFRNIIPKKWEPGLSSPFDPIASAEAEKLKIEVAIINGKKLEEVEKYLNNEKFIGTIIK